MGKSTQETHEEARHLPYQKKGLGIEREVEIFSPFEDAIFKGRKGHGSGDVVEPFADGAANIVKKGSTRKEKP